MPHLVQLTCLLLLLSGLSHGESKAPASPKDDFLITPGQSLGQIKIGELEEDVITLIGKPDFEDMAMGRLDTAWRINSPRGKYTLEILFIRDEEGHHLYLRQILITSPLFKTADGLTIGSTLDTIRALYPKLDRTDMDHGDGVTSIVLDSEEKGISFEQGPDGKCAAILLHAAGQPFSPSLTRSTSF